MGAVQGPYPARAAGLKSERGFLSLPGLGGAQMWIILGLAIACAILYWLWTGAVEDKYAIKGQFEAFANAVKVNGEVAAADTARRDKDAWDHYQNFKRANADDRARDQRIIAGLRARPPTRADGSEVPISGACPGQVPGTGERREIAELVPLDAYRALEGEAVECAVRVREVRDYLWGLIKLGVLKWE